MKRIYDDYKFGYQNYGNNFLEVPYNIIEFWHKSCFLEELKSSSIEIRYHDEIYSKYNSYKNISQSKCLYGGQIKCKLSDTQSNLTKVTNICNNLSHGTNKTKFDAVLHHKTVIGTTMNIISIGCGGSYDLKHDKSLSEIDVTFWFLSIKL